MQSDSMFDVRGCDFRVFISERHLSCHFSHILDEHLQGLCEQVRCVLLYLPYLFIRLHDLLNPIDRDFGC